MGGHVAVGGSDSLLKDSRPATRERARPLSEQLHQALLSASGVIHAIPSERAGYAAPRERVRFRSPQRTAALTRFPENEEFA